jgi:hypothetical protein
MYFRAAEISKAVEEPVGPSLGPVIVLVLLEGEVAIS